MVGIEDQDIAFAFNTECAEMFYLWEREQEAKQIEATLGAGVVKMSGDAISEITPANFRDQAW